MCPDLSVIEVKANKYLCFVLGLRKFAPWVNCPCARILPLFTVPAYSHSSLHVPAYSHSSLHVPAYSHSSLHVPAYSHCSLHVPAYSHCSLCPHTPTLHSTTVVRFLWNSFPRMAPHFCGQHDSPSNLAKSQFPLHNIYLLAVYVNERNMSISAICVCEIYIYQQYMYMRDIYLLAVHVYERYISISGIYLLATHFNYIIIYLYIMSTRSDAPLPRHIQISMYAPYIFISGICLLITYI